MGIFQEINFVGREVIGIIHDEDTLVSLSDALFGVFFVFAGESDIRAGRIPNFIAVQTSVGRIRNFHIGQAGTFAGFFLRVFEFVADKCQRF